MYSGTLITGSVGKGGANNPNDVRLVQRLLNDWLASSGQSPLLRVDGLVGPKTTGVITAFQRANAPVADGRVDVGGPTIKALFERHFARYVAALGYQNLREEVDEGAVRRSPLSDPVVLAVVARYVEALRKPG